MKWVILLISLAMTSCGTEGEGALEMADEVVAQGPAGPRGPQGEKGDPGDDGENGVDGETVTNEVTPTVPSVVAEGASVPLLPDAGKWSIRLQLGGAMLITGFLLLVMAGRRV